MSISVFDRVKESTTTTGTGTLTLAGALTGYRSASVVGTGQSSYWCVYAVDANGNPTGSWEVFQGTYTSSGTTLSRDLVIASSNGGSAVNFASGTKHVILTLPAGLSVFGSGGSTSSKLDPATISWIRRFKAQDLADAGGSNGSSVSSWTDKAGSGDPATQSTTANKPVLKTGNNGINGMALVRFDGSNDYLATTAGGESLTGDWYAAAVMQFTSIANFQNILSWGDGGINYKRRSLFKGDASGGWLYHWAFVGESADLVSTTAAAASTPYFFEVSYNSGSNTLTLWVNGTQIASGAPSHAFAAYSSSVIKLGVNPSNGEPLNGDLAEVFFLNSIPSGSTQNDLRGYVQRTYGFVVANATHVTSRLPRYYAANQLEDSVYRDSGGAGLVGTDTPGVTGGTFEGSTAILTVGGPIYADAGSTGEHTLRGSWTNQNVVAVCHTADGNTFSAVRFLRYDNNEQGAVGLGNPSGGSIFAGCMYVETSDYTRNLAGSTNAPVPLIIVSTGYIGGNNASYLRMKFDGNGDTIIYKPNSANNIVSLNVTVNGNVVVGNAAIATNATDGFLYVPTCNGVPSGTPTSYTGRCPLVYDTADNRLYVYNGGWKQVAMS